MRLLYVTPELIATKGFMLKLRKLHDRGLLNLIAIDEVSPCNANTRELAGKLQVLNLDVVGLISLDCFMYISGTLHLIMGPRLQVYKWSLCKHYFLWALAILTYFVVKTDLAIVNFQT